MKEYKVGDIVTDYGLFEPTVLKWWEYVYLWPQWKWSNFTYWFQKKYQRYTDGFSHEESFNFYNHCASWSLPRLKMLRKNLHGHPICLMNDGDDQNATNQLYFSFFKEVSIQKTSHEKWEEILDKIIWSMENLENDPGPTYPPDYDKRQIVTKVTDTSVSFGNMDDRKLNMDAYHEHYRKLQEGFDLFGKHFLSLWD